MDETTQVAVSPEEQLEAAFKKAGMDGDPPEEDNDDTPAEEAEEVEEEAQESDSAEETEEQAEADDAEEVEFEGQHYKLPKPLKEALLRQQDYTRKTQEVAAQRRQVEEREKTVALHAEFQQKHSAELAVANGLHAQIQKFSQVDWAGLAEQNPAQYLQLDRQQRELQEALSTKSAELQKLHQEFQAEVVKRKQAAQAKCIEECRTIPGFGPDMLKDLDETGKAFGFTGEELAEVVDPRVIKVLHAAMQFRKLQASKPLVHKKVQVAKPIQGKVARSANGQYQSAQLTASRERMQKTGKASDVESYLAARFEKAMR